MSLHELIDIRQKFYVFATVGVFSFSVFLGIAQPVSAAAIPKGFESREVCVASIQASPAADIAAYSKERADNRLKTLDKYTKQIENKYKNSEGTLTKAASAYKKKVGVEAPEGPRGLATNKQDALKADVNNAIATVKQLQTEVNGAGGNQAIMAEKSCAMLYDLRIYTYFNHRLRAQYAVDGLRTSTAVNQYHYEATQKLYEKNQSSLTIKALKGAVDSMPKPTARVGEIDSIQQKLDEVTIAAAGSEQFKTITEGVVGVKKNINTDRTKISEVSRKVTVGANKKAKKTSSKSSSSSSSSGSSSTVGSSSGSSSSSEKKTAKKEAKKTAKKKATLADKCKKQKGKEIRKVKGKERCVTACNSQEVVSARNAANCVCPQDHRRPPGQPRQCVHKDLLKSLQSKTTPGLSSCRQGEKRLVANGPCVNANLAR